MKFMVKTTADIHAAFKQPASTTRINSGGILSPAATLKSIPRTAGLRNFKANLAEESPLQSS